MSHKIVFVLGPTAVGKSQFATDLALEHKGFILNCDSVQAFKEVDIGSAKPDRKTRDALPHLMLDWVAPGEEFNASIFRDRALEEIRKWNKKGPIFAVGGSGFYVRALLKGTYDVKDVPNDKVQYWRNRIKVEGSEKLHGELALMDPEYAPRVSPNDAYRIGRALSLMENEGRTITQIQRDFVDTSPPFPYEILKIGFERPREELAMRIRARYQEMIHAGWIAEVEELLKRGLKNWQPLSSVGYKEIVAYLEGRLTLAQLPDAVVLSTMKLAKKQMTWFRKDPEIHWFRAGQDEGKASDLIRNFLT